MRLRSETQLCRCQGKGLFDSSAATGKPASEKSGQAQPIRLRYTLQRLIWNLEPNQLVCNGTGVRAQAVRRDATLP